VRSPFVACRRSVLAAAAVMVLPGGSAAQQEQLPGQIPSPSKGPPVVTPGATPGAPPSDAIVPFDGKDLSQWTSWADAKYVYYSKGERVVCGVSRSRGDSKSRCCPMRPMEKGTRFWALVDDRLYF
jgi:hypothetical protein